MKNKELEYFGISRQNKSDWKLKNNKKYNIILLLQCLDFDKCKIHIREIKKSNKQCGKINPKSFLYGVPPKYN